MNGIAAANGRIRAAIFTGLCFHVRMVNPTHAPRMHARSASFRILLLTGLSGIAKIPAKAPSVQISMRRLHILFLANVKVHTPLPAGASDQTEMKP